METRKPYPLRDNPHHDESVQSFMLRLRTINQFPMYTRISRDIELSSFASRLDKNNIDRLAYFSRTPVDVIAAMTSLTVTERKASINGIILPTYSVVQLCSRMCCACLAKDQYHRLIWNIAAVAACPFCGAELTEVCPTCGDRLTWERNELLECPSKGHALDISHQHPKEELPDRLMLSRIIYEKLGHDPQWPSEVAKLEPVLRDTNLGDYLDLLGFLDLFRVGGKASSLGENLDYRLWESVRMTEDWPTNFHRALQLHRASQSRGHKPVLFDAKVMRRLNSRRQNSPHRSFELFEEAANGFVLQHNIPVHSRSAFSKYSEQSVSVHIAARKMKLKASTLLTVASRAGVSIITPGEGLSPRISNSDLQRLLEQGRPEIVTGPQISKRLGIHALLAPEMIRRGLFGPDAIDRPSDVKRIKWFVTVDEFDEFQRRAQARLDAATPTLDARRWAGFQIKYQPKHVDFVDVIEGFLAGDIRASGGEVARLGQIRFCEKDILRLIQSKQLAALTAVTEISAAYAYQT